LPAETRGPLYIGSEIYRHSSYGDWHPLRIARVSTVTDLARALGWLPPERFVRSPRAKPAALHAFHRPDYVAALQEAERTQSVTPEVRARHALGTTANPVYPEMFRRPATAVGGSILAGELVAQGGIVYNPAGGTHHGMPDRANGFCYLNDPVFAILSLRRNGARRVVYVDIDAHHCDGVEAAFADEPDVALVSVHEENRWPRTGAMEDRGRGQVWNLPVPRGMGDDEMALIRDRLILPVIAAHRPDAIVLQCASDAVKEDPQSRLELSNNAHFAVVRAVMGMAPRLIVLGGGGYNPWAVGRLWCGVWGTLTGQVLPDRLPGPAQEVLRALRWHGPRREILPEPHWLETLRDVPRPGVLRDVVRDRVAALEGRLSAWA
jgi:acetoin utilization protein AcuC